MGNTEKKQTWCGTDLVIVPDYIDESANLEIQNLKKQLEESNRIINEQNMSIQQLKGNLEEEQEKVRAIELFEKKLIGEDNPNQDVDVEIKGLTNYWEHTQIFTLKQHGVSDELIAQIAFVFGKLSQLAILQGLKTELKKKHLPR